MLFALSAINQNLTYNTILPKQTSSILQISENQLSTISDKINLVVVESLLYIVNKNWDIIENKQYALIKFINRFKLDKIDKRSSIFLKMLYQIPNHNLHPEAVKRHTKKSLNSLSNTPISANAFERAEIIPYEHLWELIMENLRNNHGKRRATTKP